jgi:hypothetical protein
MEAFQNEFVVLKRCRSKKPVIHDSENQVVEVVGDGRQWEQRARGEGHEDLSEELYTSYQHSLKSISRILTSFGNESIPTWLAMTLFENVKYIYKETKE